MPGTTAQRTFGATVVEVARQLGLVLAQGTATAATGTTLTDATNMRLAVANANDLVGKFLYIYGGTSAGTVREITSYGTIGVFTWTGTATTPDTTSTWVLLKIDPQYLLDAVTWAQRTLGVELAVPYDCASLVTNDLLSPYGGFEEWTNGTTSAPDGWTLGGAGATIARNAQTMAADITVGYGLYSAAITPGAGAVAVLARQFPWRLVRHIDSQDVYLRGTISEAAASDIVVRVQHSTSAGTTTTTDRTGTYTTNRTQELTDISETAIALPALLIDVTFQVRVAAAATVAYVDDLVLYGPTLYDYELPYSLLAMEPVIYLADQETGKKSGEATRPETFTTPYYHRESWDLRKMPGTNRDILHFHRSLPSARHLLIKGIQVPGVVSATTTNLNVNADVVAAVAAAHIRGADQDVEREAARLRRQFSTITNRNSLVWVEDSLATT